MFYLDLDFVLLAVGRLAASEATPRPEERRRGVWEKLRNPSAGLVAMYQRRRYGPYVREMAMLDDWEVMR